ncbi:MAG: hypothetical protein KGD58_13820 [Candidatus Lokiarchaeota archaeon]|nr:hypothetical protein [Candidatus Lokiarchaeota archaeon]
MSEEDRFNAIIEEIKEIFLSLTQGEPSPDEEIEARSSLIKEIQKLLELNIPQVNSNLSLFEDTFIKLENWDTLELWFTESELPDLIKKIINIIEELPVIEKKQEEPEEQEEFMKQAQSDLESVKFDISEIVDQVSDKFKGEIDDLKQKIDFLKHELDAKDENLQQISQKRVVKKIVPKRDVKLPPPKIKIPVVKKPNVALQIKAPTTTEVKKPKEIIGVKSIEDVQAKIEKEIEKLKPTPPIEGKPKIYDEMQKEAKSVLNILEELEPSLNTNQQEIKFDSSSDSMSILDILDEQDTVLNIIDPKSTREKSKDSKLTSIITEASLVEEEPEYQEEITFGAIKSTIKPVSVEEIETEEIKSSGNELFNVFSSVGKKPVEKPSTTKEFPTLEPVKEKKKKEEKKKKKEADPVSFVNFGADTPQVSTQKEESTSFNTEEDLPKDKDTLYQELIALEGRRYSLEKSFKEIEKSYNMGSIDDFDYKSQSDDLKEKLDKITSRINRIRRIIASM